MNQENINTITHELSILEKAVIATKQTQRSLTIKLLSNLITNTQNGTITWKSNLIISIRDAIDNLDRRLSTQLSKILQHQDFKKLEGSWRGLRYLVSNTNTNKQLQIKVLDANKKELSNDFDRSGEFDQSQIFKKTYEDEFGTAGGAPFGIMVADYEIDNSPNDISLLNQLAGIGAAAFCPFILSASCRLFGFDSWSELSKPNDLERIFDGIEYTKWQSYRNNPDSRFVTLTLPHVLARLPYGGSGNPSKNFNFKETCSAKLNHDQYCWMSAAYILAERMTNSFSKYGWCTSIRGAEGGGKVENLPMHTFEIDGSTIKSKCPTEVEITDRREAELSKLGFLPLCHYKHTDYAVFFGAETTQKAKQYDRPEANANALISARLPYIMATSRFAHYLKVIARDKIGSFMECKDVEDWLNRWILQYVNSNARSKQDLKAKYPLANAKISVQEVPGRPGSYQAIAWLQPWLQLEELTTSIRLVARIPTKGN